ncbi:hypothetical protein B0H15DRAFT_934119 [Mycena belliarum]|uniref:Uncharacterized protein n=1 Tax=Mycena belliarum TaxID=1033014 RepID=A0AAD6TUS0_9AGAR|nr:hypothetical protein B0H15DRAFT_934119 [Mycena belliae]
MITRGPAAQYMPLLAVFNFHFDPSKIPPLDPSDASVLDSPAVDCAWSSLLSVFALTNIPAYAFLEMWPNLWQWVLFFQLNYDRVFLPEDNFVEGGICLSFLSFMNGLSLTDDMIQMILATPRVVYLITRAWHFRVYDKDRDLSSGYPAISNLFLRRTDSITAATTQEMLDAVGGSHADLAALASLVVTYINAVLPGHTELLTTNQAYLLFDLIEFVPALDDFIEGRTVSHYRESLGQFASSLLPFGIARALTNAAWSLVHQKEMEGAEDLLRKCSILVIRILGDSRGYRFTREALNAGLMFFVASCGGLGVVESSGTILLQQILPASLIRYYDLKPLEQGILEAQGIAQSASFQRSAFGEKWRAFVVLVLSITARENVKVPTGGQAVIVGPATRETPFILASEGTAKELLVRERAYIRAVVAHDYATQKWTTVHPKQVELMRTQPPGLRYFTLFDYRTGKVKISVHAVEKPHGGAPYWDGFAGAASWDEGITLSREWRNDIARASASGGTLQLHVVAIAVGPRTRYLVVPFRTNSARTHRHLTRLGDMAPPLEDIPELVRAVKMAAMEESDIVETH